MKLNRKNLLTTTIVTFVVAFFVPLLFTASILDIYECAGQNLAAGETCPALESAQWKIQLGITLQFVSWSLFLVSFCLYLWFVLRKKK